MIKILVVDDDLNLRTLYKQILEAQNYTVEIAPDGGQGLSHMLKGGYDLVLLDVRMPQMSGIQVMIAYNKIGPKLPNKKIYFLTNDKDEMTIAQGISTAANGYLIKSQYTPDKLVAEVERILRS